MHKIWKITGAAVGLLIIGTATGTLGARAQSGAKPDPSKSSYISVNEEDFRTVLARMSSAKAQVMKRQMDLLGARYDLSDRPAAGVTMSRGKAIQEGSASSSPGEPRLGSSSEDDPGRNPREGAVPGRLHAPAAPEPPRGGHGLSDVPDHRGQEADGPLAKWRVPWGRKA